MIWQFQSRIHYACTVITSQDSQHDQTLINIEEEVYCNRVPLCLRQIHFVREESARDEWHTTYFNTPDNVAEGPDDKTTAI